jgi:hypothetical protein
MKKILFAALFMLTSVIYSNENIAIERPSFDLKLKIDEENFFQTTIPKLPYIVDNKYLTIYPGETLFVEADVINDTIVKFTVVKEIKNKDKTIVLKFEQTTKKENPKVHEMMLLKITNPFNKKLVYKANIHLVLQGKLTRTSIIPVMAKLISYESWPDIIGAVFLYDFVLE